MGRVARIGANGVILGLWLWLYRPVFDYLSIIFSRSDFRTNQVMLVGVVGLILWQIRRQGVGVTVGLPPRLFVPELGLALGGAAVALLSLQPLVADGCAGGEGENRAQPAWLSPGLVVAILVMALVYAPRPQVGLAQAPPTWRFPAGLVVEPEPLRSDEVTWLTRDGAESAERFRFEWRTGDGEETISGSLMLITSRTWRAQHRPERCFEVYGLSLNGSRVHLVAPDFPVRSVSLGDEHGRDVASASYWFQSAQRTTADYGTRMWADLAAERERWVLVTVLFYGVHDPHPADLDAFYVALHGAVARSFE